MVKTQQELDLEYSDGTDNDIEDDTFDIEKDGLFD
jgi:hypothetical protein